MARSNKTRYALLGMLSMGPASGYDIKKSIQQSTDHFWSESDGAIYPILRQLLEEGMVTCETVNPDSGKPKKIYHLTEAGEQELKQWLYLDPEVYQRRNEFLLKVFFGWNVENEVTIDHIQALRRKIMLANQYYQSFLEKFNKQSLSREQRFRLLTLRAGVMFTEAKLQWCDEALETLKQEQL